MSRDIMWQPISTLSPAEQWWGVGIALGVVFVPMLAIGVGLLLEAAKERRR